MTVWEVTNNFSMKLPRIRCGWSKPICQSGRRWLKRASSLIGLGNSGLNKTGKFCWRALQSLGMFSHIVSLPEGLSCAAFPSVSLRFRDPLFQGLFVGYEFSWKHWANIGLLDRFWPMLMFTRKHKGIFKKNIWSYGWTLSFLELHS
jgi:hypothetical protein